MMKKILYAVTKSNFGGAQRYVYELASEAKNKGYSVAVACGGNGSLVDRLESAHIEVFNIASAERDIHIFKEIQSLIRFIAILRDVKPDILHLNSPKLGGLGAFAGRLMGIKEIVYTNHGWPFMEHRPLWQKILIRFFSWLTLLLNKRIIVLSHTEFAMTQNWPGAKDKVHIIRNGIQNFVLQDKDHALISIMGEVRAIELIKSGKRIIGSIAELHKNKGHQYALEGFKLYKNFAGPSFNSHLLIIGNGDDKDKLLRLRSNLELDDDVTFVGYVRDAREYLKAFDVCMMSSIKEGFPYALLEAGYAEVPIISTDVGGIHELIENLRTGFLIPARRPQEIKHILNYIDEHPGESRQYAYALKEKIKNEFTFEKQVSATFALYGLDETGR